MFCEHCGVQNPETAIYCRACGKRMEGKRENQPHHHVFQGTILFLAGPLTGRSFPLIPPVTTLGRDPSNTIVVPDPAMSPFHARLVLTGSGWVVELLAPENTLMVSQNQTRQQLLRDQDVIRLGYGTVFRYGLNMGRPQYPQPPVPPVQPPPPGQTWQSQPFPPVPRPQQIRYGPLLSRRTVLIGGAALAGGLLLVVGGVKIVSSLFASSSPSHPFGHVALGTPLVTYQGHHAKVHTVAWSPDSRLVASGAGDPDSTARVWTALDGTEVYTYPEYAKETNPTFPVTVISLAWSPDGKRIVTNGNGTNHEIQTWDATDGGRDTTFRIPSALEAETRDQVAWSPDGAHIAVASSYIDLTTSNTGAGAVLVFDAVSGSPLPYHVDQNTIICVDWSPDSKRIVSGDDSGIVQIWDAATGNPVSTFTGHTRLVTSVAWSPDGTRIVSGSYDQTARIWDAASGTTIKTYSGHSREVETVTWSPDSKWIASGGDDWTVQIWDAADARGIYLYKGHRDLVRQVAWSPDGTRIASASFDQTVQVWGAG